MAWLWCYIIGFCLWNFAGKVRRLFTLLNHNSVVVECAFQACHFRTPKFLFFSGKHDPKSPSGAIMLTGSSPTLELLLTYRDGLIAGYLAPRFPFVLSVDIFLMSNNDFDSWFVRDLEKIFSKNNSLMQTLTNKCSRLWNWVKASLLWGEKMASTQNFLYPANAVVFLFPKFPLAFHAFHPYHEIYQNSNIGTRATKLNETWKYKPLMQTVERKYW